MSGRVGGRKSGFLSGCSIVFVWLGLLLVFSLLVPGFFSAANVLNLIQRNTHLFIIAVGLSFVIAGGWVDLSVGYQVSLICVLMAWLLKRGVPSPAALLIGILTGIACGALNGLLITKLNLAPFAATLATQVMFRGASYVISSGYIFTNIPDSFRVLSETSFLKVPLDTWLILLCILVASLIFSYTYFGRYVLGIRENENTVKNAGVNVDRVKRLCFAICGGFCALASIVLVSNQGRANSYTGPGMEITCIAAVFLSDAANPPKSARLTRFQAWKLLFGVLTLVTIEQGTNRIGWNPFIRYIITGILLAWSFTRAGRVSH